MPLMSSHATFLWRFFPCFFRVNPKSLIPAVQTNPRMPTAAFHVSVIGYGGKVRCLKLSLIHTYTPNLKSVAKSWWTSVGVWNNVDRRLLSCQIPLSPDQDTRWDIVSAWLLLWRLWQLFILQFTVERTLLMSSPEPCGAIPSWVQAVFRSHSTHTSHLNNIIYC
jgi:hypothetical protein